MGLTIRARERHLERCCSRRYCQMVMSRSVGLEMKFQTGSEMHQSKQALPPQTIHVIYIWSPLRYRHEPKLTRTTDSTMVAGDLYETSQHCTRSDAATSEWSYRPLNVPRRSRYPSPARSPPQESSPISLNPEIRPLPARRTRVQKYQERTLVSQRIHDAVPFRRVVFRHDCIAVLRQANGVCYFGFAACSTFSMCISGGVRFVMIKLDALLSWTQMRCIANTRGGRWISLRAFGCCFTFSPTSCLPRRRRRVSLQ